MSQRTWQAPAGPSALSGAAERIRPGEPAEPESRTGQPAEPESRTGQPAEPESGPGQPAEPEFRPGQPAEPAARPGGVLLTGRGAVVVVFALCLVGMAVSGWLHLGMLAGLVFVAASCLAAARTQRSDLLVVAVTPPALFLLAVICVKALGSSGNVLSTAEGTLITLANNAPWLLAGTLLSVVIAFCRGMWDNVRTLRKDLRGDPIRRAN